MSEDIISLEEVDRAYEKLKKDTTAVGYFLNPDEKFTWQLVRGLLINEKRYGYQNCPCRFATGIEEQDRDIICPCDYRDQDVEEFGACF